jgi:hypothetical protein
MAAVENACETDIEIDIALAPSLNVAFFQNSVPVLRDVIIVNNGTDILEAIELRIGSEPLFFTPKLWRIERIGPGQRYHLSDLSIDLDGGFLARLTEAERAQVIFTVVVAGRTPIEARRSIELLARNQWAGIKEVPELLAAFIQPNDPAVDRILKSTAKVLREAGKDSALDGYQQGTKARAWELISALWSAVRSLSLDYALPAASFEITGQKIRSPSHILETGITTCLDLTLLFAACLEQLALNPIIVFTKGHSFVGCWLKPEEMATATVDDITAVRKRIGLQELVVFETTLATGNKPGSFKYAIERGAQQLARGEDENFEIVVDIRRARQQRVRPLAATEPSVSVNVGDAAAAETAVEFEEAPPLEEESLVEPKELHDETPSGRLAQWQRRLLDLSLRNNLLNYRATKRTVVLDAPDPSRLEDELAAGKELKIRPRPEIMQGSDPRDERLHRDRYQEDARRELSLEALRRNEVLVGLPQDELDARLIDLYRTARLGLQEGGANTLFIALGFLTWKREPKDERSYRAPLILIPVSLQRTSVRSGFRLVLHEDEPRFNPTLVEMLRQDFHLQLPFGETELPKDDSGLDVRLIWRTVADSIKEISGWEVGEDVILSTFSFAKYLMWKDLVDRTEQLKESPVVRHLIDNPKDPYPSEIAFPKPETLDDVLNPATTFCPLPVDSSQLAAVVAAASGKDFVLVGPPGTGKSQTISNIIAQCLAEDKTILFVSEKIAALDVVYRRLRAVGLGDFCLEIHSNKAKKVEVLEQLRQSWAARGTVDHGVWEREAARLKALRDQLNDFVRHLHKRHRNGLSARTAIAHIVSAYDLPELNFAWPALDTHDEVQLNQLRNIVDRVQINVAEAEVTVDTPLQVVLKGEWSPNWQQSLVQNAGGLAAAAQGLHETAREFFSATGLPDIPLDGRRRSALANLAAALPQAAGRDWRFVLRPDAQVLRERLGEGLKLIGDRKKKCAELSISYPPEAFKTDTQEQHSLWNSAHKTWWPKSAFMRRKVRRALTTLASDRKARPDCGHDLNLLAAIREFDQTIDRQVELGGKTGGLWNGLSSNTAEIRAALAFAETLLHGVATLANNAQDLGLIRIAIERLIGEANNLLEPAAPVTVAASNYLQALEVFETAARRFAELAGVLMGNGHVNNRTIEQIQELAAGIAQRQNKLRSWCAWRRVRAEAIAVGLGGLVAAIEGNSLDRDRIVEAFEANYCRWWLNELVGADKTLCNFVSAEHERRIHDFREIDDKLMKLTREYVRARLCAGLPDPGDISRGSEWGTLKREMEKKRRHMPLRQLVGALPNALTTLSPCLLMSPLSIAQYLPAGQTLFDVVVFDEASQIPVWDAVGAIARGKQAIIVGDPKQLPPTSFFDRAREDDDEDIIEDGDLESILDECLGANLPSLSLNWHYRSRHESLIAFSNHRYYGGGLVTFPSPVVEDHAVSFHHVEDGIYERGGGRINQPEARALVADIMHRLKDQDFVESGLSIGVVTFNAEQQRLIEDMVDHERAKDSSIESFFAEDNPEALFVKNLESVQGDERDVMYFSIAYGPDRSGAVSMNFGPINKDGGERRLNVAVTRARHELRVFSSLLPERIDLSRTQALGVRDLKHFLEFAIRGPRALAEATFGSVGSFESPFEEAVAAALAERGWLVHPQIGVSTFRVDLGIVHPDRPGAFLAGIECDGATYHRAATARDRDKLREHVLKGLGWKIIRVWSPDWWTDREGTLEKVNARLDILLAESRDEAPNEPVIEKGHDATTRDEKPICAQDGMEPTPDDVNITSASAPSWPKRRPETYARNAATKKDTPSFKEPSVFRIADPTTVVRPDPEAFYEQRYSERLAEMIQHVIAVEGPVRDEVLARRIANAHGFQRAGGRIRKRVERLARRVAQTTREDVGIFFWPEGVDLSRFDVFRRPPDGNTRPIDDIAIQELTALARELATVGYDDEEAIVAMARAAGLQRLRAATRPRLIKVWQEVKTKP